jgi:hypothetical protein
MPVRSPTRKEKRQLIRYVQTIADWHFYLADYAVASWYIAVFDDYVTRGYHGKLMVTICNEGIVELLGWNGKGKLFSLYCTG